MAIAASDICQHANGDPQPVRRGDGAPILDPRNVLLEHENPSLLASPHTDSGTIPNLWCGRRRVRSRAADRESRREDASGQRVVNVEGAGN
jgi:oxalate decarboxylase